MSGLTIEQETARRMALEMEAMKAGAERTVPKAHAAPIAAAAPAPLKAGQVTFMSMFPAWKGADFGVTIYDPELLPEALRSQIPTVDPDYLPNMDAAAQILLGWELGDKVYSSGDPGVGKSSLFKHLAALTRRPFIRINLNEDIESAALLGQPIVKGGEVVYSFGPVSEGIQYPSVILLDEGDRASSGIMLALQWLLEDGGKLFLRDMPGTNAERTITPHDGCRVCMAGNTIGLGDETGSHSSAKVQDTAFLDRFKTTVRMTYLAPAQETAMLTKKFPKVDPVTLGEMVRVANLIRGAKRAGELSLTMSPRTLFSWAEKSAILGVKQAVIPAFLNKLPAGEQPVAAALIQKAFPG